MGFPINGDLVPSNSGFANLGVDVGPNAINAFDFSSLRPFGHIHQNSGVFHHATSTGWESGVLRFNSADPAFEVSLDGGITFNNLVTAATVVTSVGVIGDADLTGDVDFASPASGFIVIEDTGDASPLLWSVDTAGLSGLWNFPAQGFDRIPTCYNESFTSETQLAVTHSLNTINTIVQVYDSNDHQLIPDRIVTTDANTVTIQFNVSTTGRVVVMACENS